MWHLMNKITKQKQTHRYREQTDSCQRGGRLGGGVKKVKGLRKKHTTQTNSDTDNSTVITRGSAGRGEAVEGKRELNGDRYTDDVL